MQEVILVETGFDEGDIRRIALDKQGRVDENIHCLTCGYNLRTILLEAACRECGVKVVKLIRSDFRRFSIPQYMKKISSGTSLIWGAVVMHLILFIAVIFIMATVLSLDCALSSSRSPMESELVSSSYSKKFLS